MNYLPFAKETERSEILLIIRKIHDMFICCACFLFRRKILVYVCNRVTRALYICSRKRNSVRVSGVNSVTVYGVVTDQSRFGQFVKGCIAHGLIDHNAYHFPVCDFFSAQRSIGNVPQRKFSSKSCVSWALGT